MARACALPFVVIAVCVWAAAASARLPQSYYAQHSALHPVQSKSKRDSAARRPYVGLLQKAAQTYGQDVVRTSKAAYTFLTSPSASGHVIKDECSGMVGQLEIEVLYLLIRQTKPKRIMELGCLCGYSTFWILQALEDNGGDGVLISFDIAEAVKNYISAADNVRGFGRWTFVHGDVKETYSTHATAPWDLVFIDALHHNQFAAWYIENILNALQSGTYVMVHDIFNPLMVPEFFHTCAEVGLAYKDLPQLLQCMQNKSEALYKDPNTPFTIQNSVYGSSAPSGEGVALLNYLSYCNCAAHMFTLSPFKDVAMMEAYLHIRGQYIQEFNPASHVNNPALFFRIQNGRQS